MLCYARAQMINLIVYKSNNGINVSLRNFLSPKKHICQSKKLIYKPSARKIFKSAETVNVDKS